MNDSKDTSIRNIIENTHYFQEYMFNITYRSLERNKCPARDISNKLKEFNLNLESLVIKLKPLRSQQKKN